MTLLITYSLLAAIAMAANIGAQHLTLLAYAGKFAMPLSVAVGTGVGLVIKYMLDKKFIFRFQATSAVHDGTTFILYTAMGLATTVIFWGTEAVFQAVFHTDFMRYLGAVLGLTVGYIVKYNLDKNYVFRNAFNAS
ncbi:GtrA family protein [Paraburkholderia dioscoreae]|uniref:GtrA-like protein n=1 Tax=Paraburkholderia dioscoreae TaxID=2604047 RepID=A0A5Q4YV86_9BURK|nr:GtrA family protein [Paraburkholderia dioscoreae]VVD28312.1 GtrA-like protein [Paraburkholderia dioscoreae]